MNDDSAAIVARGQEASLLESALAGFLEAERKRILDQMISRYRGTEVDPIRFYGLAGELSALAAIQSALTSRQRQGVSALAKELSNGP